MARQPEVRYINTYVSGTAVPQLEKKPQRKPAAKLPQVKRETKYVIPVDVVAVGGILAAVVLCIMLVVGLFQMNQAQQEAQMYREYATTLQAENEQLKDTYASGYDLEEVRAIAQAMGMVPAEQVTHMQMQVVEAEIPEEPTAWENFWAFLAGMFA